MQGLVLAGALHHEGAEAEKSSQRRAVVGHVGDLGQRHHGNLLGDQPVGQDQPLVGGDEPVVPPLEDLPDRPPDQDEPGPPEEICQEAEAGWQGGVERENQDEPGNG